MSPEPTPQHSPLLQPAIPGQDVSSSPQKRLDLDGVDVILTQGVVDYRLRTGFGVRVVRVFLNGPEPRIMAWVEKAEAHGVSQTPMSLGFSEIELYVQNARHRL